MGNVTTAPRKRAALPRGLRGKLRPNMVAPYIGLILILAIWFAKNPNAMSVSNLNTQILTAMTLALAATAQTIVILSGGIDLSVAGVISLTTAIFATRGVEDIGTSIVWMVILVLIGALVGTINGLIIAYLKLESFIVTLATWSILTGIGLFLLPIPGGTIPSWYVSLVGTRYLGLAVGVWLFILLAIFGIWFRRVRLGRAIRAVGSDPTSAFLSGVPIRLTTVTTFALSGVFGALAGIFLTSQTASGQADAGDPFILTSIAAVVIGGTTLAGGRGGIGGSLVGAVIITIIASVVFSYNISSFWTPLIIGVLLIGSVIGGSALDAFSRRAR